MQKRLTFAISAYKDSPYLEDCVLALKRQTVPAEILIATSTPSEYIRTIAEKHGLPYYVNPQQKGIASDWKFAMSQAKTELVCLAHQDDIYLPDYAERILLAVERTPDCRLVFTDSGDLMPNGKIDSHRAYLKIKRLLLWAFYLKGHHRSHLLKLSSVCFGNAICCPSVTYNVEQCGSVNFDDRFTVDLDWKMWYDQAKGKGAFVYIPKVLMAHRISPTMETASAIADNRRYREDSRLFEMIWGRTLARILMRFYSLSYNSNRTFASAREKEDMT